MPLGLNGEFTVASLPDASFGAMVCFPDGHDIKTTISALEASPTALPSALYAAQGLLLLKGMEAITENPQLLLRLSRLFGPEVEDCRRTLLPRNWIHDSVPEIMLVSNQWPVNRGPPARPNPPLTTDGRLPTQFPHRRGWHTDQSYRRPPPDISLLYAVTSSPDKQGQTLYANSTAAYEELAMDLRERLDDLQGLHVKSGAGRSEYTVKAGRTPRGLLPHEQPQQQPVVRLHPVTGKRALYLSESYQMDWVQGPFVGMQPGPYGDGAQLLYELMTHVTQERFVYVHHWKAGDLVVYDNRCLLHTATWFDGVQHSRMMWRTTVAGNPGPKYAGDKKSWLRGDPYSALHVRARHTPQKHTPNFHTNAYLDAARKMGLGVEVLNHDRAFCRIHSFDKSLFLMGSALSCNDTVSAQAVGSKHIAHERLFRAGIPVPVQRYFRLADRFVEKQLDEIFDYAADRYPVVLKPDRGSLGRYVYTNISTDIELTLALNQLLKAGVRRLIVEKFVPGNVYRALVCKGEIVDIVERIPPTVIGTGNHTVKELVSRTNASRKRYNLPPIRLTRRVLFHLEQQGISRNSVPQPGQRIRLTTTVNVSQGAEACSVDESTIPNETKDTLLHAAKTCRLVLAGLDYVSDDIALVGDTARCGIIDINPNPQLRGHVYCNRSYSLAAVERVLELLFE